MLRPLLIGSVLGPTLGREGGRGGVDDNSLQSQVTQDTQTGA